MTEEQHTLPANFLEVVLNPNIEPYCLFNNKIRESLVVFVPTIQVCTWYCTQSLLPSSGHVWI
jgi:hypothetical protein